MADITSDLLIHLPFSETEGTVAKNLGSQPDANLVNLNFATNSVPGVSTIKPSRALNRKTAGQIVNCGPMTGLVEGEDATLAAWVRTNGTDVAYLFSDHTGSGGTYGIFLDFLSGSTVVRVQPFVNGTTQQTADLPIVAGEWSHIGIVFDASVPEFRFYDQGVFFAGRTVTAGGTWLATTDMQIGERPTAGINADVSFDDARIYKRALTDEDMLELFNYPGVADPSTGIDRGSVAIDIAADVATDVAY